MDLMKLLKARKETRDLPRGRFSLFSKPSLDLTPHFLTRLIALFRDDLTGLQKLEESSSPLHQIGLVSGHFNVGKNPSGTPAGCHFLFVRLPGKPGLLLEEQTNDTEITLTRATQTQQYVSTPTGESTANPMFVAKSSVLERFSILDNETVRSTLGKTMSVEQMSELLLRLAFDELEPGT